MKLTFSRLSVALLLAMGAGSAEAADLLISEYIEASVGNNKALELYNGTGTPVNLSGYKLELYANGRPEANGPTSTISLPDIELPNGGTYVVCNTSAIPPATNAEIPATSCQQLSGSITHNGDDAWVLRRTDNTVVDSFGQVGVDPGTGWGTGGTSTVDRTLRRKSSVCSGDTSISDAFDPATEWDGFDDRTYAGLGTHSATCAGGPILISINDVALAEGNAGTTIFTFTVGLSAPAGAGGVTFDIATADGTATAGSDYIASSLTGQTIPAGSSTYSFTVTVNGETAVEGNEGFLVNISNVVGATVGDASGLGTILNDDAAAAAIHDIQGNGSESPFDGTAVTTSGIVTAKRSNGFFMQSPDASVDADSMTSEAVFVFTGTAPAFNIGDLVQVTGTVDEFAGSGGVYNMPSTQLQPSSMVVSSTGNPLPAAVEITAAMLGASSLPDVLEHLEGMRVTVASGKIVAQSPGNTNEDSVTSSDLNGEFEIVVAGVQRPLREAGISIFDPYPAAPTIPLFDANQERLKVYPLVVPSGGTPRVDAGGTVSNLAGVLTYFGSNFAESAWELLYDADAPPTIVPGTAQAVSDPTSDDVTIAGFNMLRLFDDIANGSGPTLSTLNFDKRVTKAAAVICDWLKTPDILGAVEVENLNALSTLANKLNSTCASEPTYVAYLQEGNDVGGIDVGFLVNTRAAGAVSRVQVVEIEQHGKTTTWSEPGGDTSLLNDRPPLRLKALVTLDDGRNYPITAIVVHQRSLNGNDATGSSGDRVRAKRAKQAEFLAQLVDDLQTANPDEKIVLVGDFNAFEVNDGYVDAMGITTGNPAPASEVVFWADSPLSPANGGIPLIMGNELIADPEQRYSYIFGNISQSLDHAVVNEALAMDPGVAEVLVDHARVNADFRHGHFAEFDPPYTSENPPLRTSDHDPVRISIRLAQILNADLSVTASAESTQIGSGDTAVFHVDVANAGPSSADPASLSIMFDGLVTPVVEMPSGWTCAAATQDALAHTTTVDCTASEFASSAADRFTVSVASTGTPVLRMTATVASSTGDPNSANNQATAQVLAGQAADLGVNWSGEQAQPGLAKATLTLRNDGPDAASGAVANFRLTLPRGVFFSNIVPPAGWGCKRVITLTAFRCTTSRSIPAGSSSAFQFVALGFSSGTSSNAYVLEATISSETTDPDLSDNAQTVSFP
ncbi:lamin tail domain-containing protein [Thermomonas carbonis]|uniref:Lamin tail domain-containing protein n=1 Tax=Thermomonas carbonis TaxID=1463158 RepID=A0A7G9SU14_9GAMM|nr:lamin tail domain-containing protein [Thermomonas carbonis]QNN71339.1 lamin tail domain-containing protein [Thermomonas carbonis]